MAYRLVTDPAPVSGGGKYKLVDPNADQMPPPVAEGGYKPVMSTGGDGAGGGGGVSDTPPMPQSYLSRVGHNIVPSGIAAAKDMAQPFLHPVDTAINMYKIAKGAGQYATGHQGTTDEMKMASAVKDYYINRYGSWDKTKEAFASDPVGVALDAATVLTMGGGLAERAPGVVGKLGEITSAAGRAIDPIRAVTRPTGAVARHVIGHMTGTSPDVLGIASDAGRAGGVEAQMFQGHLRGNRPITEPYTMARQGLQDMREEKQSRYLGGIASSKANQSYIPMGPINKAFGDLDASHTIRTPSGTHYYTVGERSQQAMDEIEKLLVTWNSDPELHSVMGLDGLKRRIEDLRPDAPSPQERRIFKTMGDAVRAQIEKHEPTYKAAMQDYTESSRHEKDIERALSLGDNASTDTALRKLTSGMRNNVNANFGYRKSLIGELNDRTPGLKEAAAGQHLNSPNARGLAAGTGPISRLASAVNPFSSPRLMGEAAYYTGKFSPVRRNLHLLGFEAGRANQSSKGRKRNAVINALER